MLLCVIYKVKLRKLLVLIVVSNTFNELKALKAYHFASGIGTLGEKKERQRIVVSRILSMYVEYLSWNMSLTWSDFF